MIISRINKTFGKDAVLFADLKEEHICMYMLCRYVCMYFFYLCLLKSFSLYSRALSFFFLRFLSLVPDAKPIKERVSAFKDAL